MTKLKNTPAEALSVDEAERALAERTAELAAVRGDIASLEASLPDLAKQDDDERFESASLELGRLQRRELRAQTRIEQAREALTEAEGREKEAKRQTLYAEGQAACSEAEKLIKGEYREHAAAISKVLGRLAELSAAVEIANKNLPDNMPAMESHLDLDSFRHEADTPAGTTIEIQYYHIDENGRECAPQYTWDPTSGKNVLRSKLKSREKTVRTRAWSGTKMSPLIYAVKLPAAVHGEDTFWPLPEPPAKYYEPTITYAEPLQTRQPAQPALHGAVQPDGSRVFRLPPCSLAG